MLYTRILWATLGAILATAMWLMTTGSRLPTVSSSHDQALSSSDAIAPAADCVDLSPSSSATTNDPCVPGPVLLPGMKVNRQVGPVLFVLVVDSNEARVNAQVSLGNAALTDPTKWKLTQIRLRPQTADNSFKEAPSLPPLPPVPDGMRGDPVVLVLPMNY